MVWKWPRRGQSIITSRQCYFKCLYAQLRNLGFGGVDLHLLEISPLNASQDQRLCVLFSADADASTVKLQQRKPIGPVNPCGLWAPAAQATGGKPLSPSVAASTLYAAGWFQCSLSPPRSKSLSFLLPLPPNRLKLRTGRSAAIRAKVAGPGSWSKHTTARTARGGERCSTHRAHDNSIQLDSALCRAAEAQ